MTDRGAIGRLGETSAARFLEQNGYRIIERNYRCRYGEIDIVARDGQTLAFVEVKTRGNENFGTPLASVDERKQRKIALAAHFFIESRGIGDADMRFDVVGVSMGGGKATFELVKDAFETPE